MKVDTIQTSFVGGELAPSLFGRTDVAQYQNACAIVDNFLVRPYGTLISTPGTEYINACKTGGSTSLVRLLQFVFSRTDSYIIEMGVGYFRFYTDGAVVVSPGTTPYEIAHTYTAAELDEIQFAQINDVIYITHKSHAPAKLTRLSSTSWTLTDFAFTGGPYLPDNVIYSGGTTIILSSATITPSGTSGSVTLSASSNIFIPSGSTTAHINTFWKVGATITDSTTGLAVQGYVKITAITNPSTATATVVKTLAGTAATTIWAQGSWSSIMGWPARVTFHQQRLCFARTDYQPQNVWCSQSFTYENFSVNGGSDDDAIDIQIAATEANEIKWLVSGDSLIAGTYGGDFVIKTGDDSPLTPANTNAFKQTSWGSEAIPPKRIGNFFYYIQRFSQKLRELFYFWDLNSYKSIDKTILSPHISNTGFKDFTYQQNPDTVLWCVCSDGTLATMTREIDQEVQAWGRQTTDGYYESIASIPSQDEPHDEVWVVVRRNINGTDVRYIERFKSQVVPTRQEQCFYVHSGLTYDAYNATVTPTSTSMSFTYPNAVTKLLLHCNGTNESTVFTDSAAARTVTASGSTQISTSVKKFGTGSAWIPNVSGIDSSTKLLLHLDNNITDSSASARVLTNNNVTFSSIIKEFGGYSGYFNGVDSYLSIPSSADWSFGTSSLTIDMWAYWVDTAGTQDLISQAVSGGNSQYWRISQLNGTTLRFTMADAVGTTLLALSASVDISKNTFHHIAVVRDSTTFTLYFNGEAVDTETSSASFVAQASTNIEIGRFGPGGSPTFYMNGYIDEVRISTGVARWTSDFVPPSFEYTSGTDNLSLADNADWNFATGDFTIDGWVNHNDLTDAYALAGQYADANNYWYVGKGTNALGNKLNLFFRSASSTKASYVMASSSSLAISTWTHLAYVRSSSTVKMYINGVSQALTETTAISTNDVGDVAASLVIGQQNATSLFKGYVDEFRITKGSPLWTADFTPPTSEGTQSGTTALVTSSAAYFSAGSVGKRLRAIDSSGAIVGQLTVSGYTSSTIVVGTITEDFDAFSYAAGLWGISVSSISGLGHLEGETVSVLADGVKDSPNKVVSSGAITLLVDAFYVNAGLPYIQKFKSLPQEAGSQRGTAQGKLQRINQVAIKVNNSYDGFQIGPDEDSLDTLRQSSTSLYTGTIANKFFPGGYVYGAQVVIENPDPLPVEILSLITTIDTNDKN